AEDLDVCRGEPPISARFRKARQRQAQADGEREHERCDRQSNRDGCPLEKELHLRDTECPEWFDGRLRFWSRGSRCLELTRVPQTPVLQNAAQLAGVPHLSDRVVDRDPQATIALSNSDDVGSSSDVAGQTLDAWAIAPVSGGNDVIEQHRARA